MKKKNKPSIYPIELGVPIDSTSKKNWLKKFQIKKYISNKNKMPKKKKKKMQKKNKPAFCPIELGGSALCTALASISALARFRSRMRAST